MVGFIKAGQLQEQLAVDHETGAGHHVEFAKLADFRSVGGGMAMRVIGNPVDKFDAGVLDVSVGIKESGSDNAGAGLLCRLSHRVEPAGRDLRVIV